MGPKFKVEVVGLLKVHLDDTEAFTVSVLVPAATAMPEMQVKAAIAATLKVTEVSFMFVAEVAVCCGNVYLKVSIRPVQVKHLKG